MRRVVKLKLGVAAWMPQRANSLLRALLNLRDAEIECVLASGLAVGSGTFSGV
jgi:hypothetical protein